MLIFGQRSITAQLSPDAVNAKESFSIRQSFPLCRAIFDKNKGLFIKLMVK
jgi:hypothetical protein